MADVFISHATADDAVILRLRKWLGLLGVTVWVDSQELRGGDPLDPAIRQAIEDARHFIAVLTERSVQSQWVDKEIRHARQVQRGLRAAGGAVAARRARAARGRRGARAGAPGIGAAPSSHRAVALTSGGVH